MGLTFRGEKGSPLLHTELDNNFREFFYSASVSGSDLLMFRSRSLDNTVTLPLSYPKGGEYAIQLKKGNALSGSGTSFSGSQNLIYDFRENTTKISGSLIISSSRVNTPFQVQGSGSITGDLVVGGKVTAEEFITEYSTVAVSTIYKSGSSKFGDTLDDIHTFTGSINVSGSQEIKGDQDIVGDLTVEGSAAILEDLEIENDLVVTGSVEILRDLSVSATSSFSGSMTHIGILNRIGNTTIDGVTTISGNTTVTGSFTLTGSNHSIIGDVTTTGDSTIIGSSTISGSSDLIGDFTITGSIRHLGDYIQVGDLDLSGFDINSQEITASANITIGEFTTGSTGLNPFLLLAGGPNQRTSSAIIFADNGTDPAPNHSGMQIRFDSKGNSLNIDSLESGSEQYSIFRIGRNGNLSITGRLTLSGDEDTVFDNSIVVSDLISGSRAEITEGVSAGSLTGSIDASNLENVPYAVTASNTFFGDQNVVGDITASNLDVSGDTLIEGNLTVNGTGSFAFIQSVTGSAKIIGDAFIQLNENTPTERYAGIQVVDSGSVFSTASFFFDGLENNWMYEYSNDDTNYALALFGPEFSTKGSPVSLTQDTVPIASGSHHLIDSDIFNDSVKIRLNKNTQVTGSLNVSSGVQVDNIGVGTAAPGTTGLIRATNDVVAFYSSDERLKDNIVRISNPIEKIKQIKGVEFDWNDKQEVYEGHDVGVLAQDIEKVLPELVTTRDNGYKAVKYEKIIALLIEAVKDQQSQIDELKSKL